MVLHCYVSLPEFCSIVFTLSPSAANMVLLSPAALCSTARRLDALSVRHLLEHSGPRPLRLIDLSAPGSADLPLLAAALEHPLLEVKGGRLVPDLSLWELHLS